MMIFVCSVSIDQRKGEALREKRVDVSLIFLFYKNYAGLWIVYNFYELIYIKSNSHSPLSASLGFVSKLPHN